VESKDIATLGAVAGVVVLLVVFGKAFTNALKELFDAIAPPSGAHETGPPRPRAEDEGAGGRLTGRILDFNRTVGGWEAQVEVTNGGTAEVTTTLQLYAKQNWNLGGGADEIIDLAKRVTIPPESTSPITFVDRDSAFSLASSYSVTLYADGVQLDYKA
jgi:hypothetical protein